MDAPQKQPVYLFTDIDSSTERWERAPSQMKAAVARHDQIIDDLVDSNGGTVKEANVTGFPVSDKLAGIYMTLETGAFARAALAR